MEHSQNRAEGTIAETGQKGNTPGPKRHRSFEPVSTPASVHWREFRARLLPPMMFCAAVAVVIVCWRQVGTSTGMSGVGEGARAMVSTPFPSRLQALLVKPYQTVRAGDPVAIVIPSDPRIELDLLQTELGLSRLLLQPTIAEENAMGFERIRVDLLRTKAELAVAKVNLERAANQVRRNEPLFKEKLVSEDIYDLSAKTRDMYAVEVLEKSNAVAQIEQRVSELQSLGLPQGAATNSVLATTLDRLRALQLAASSNLEPVTLTAPIDGMVTMVARRAGENVIDGEPIVGISSFTSERVIGYLRQPYPMQPEVGLEVSMITRERNPRRFTGAITEIGAQVEMITNALAFIRPGTLVDAGLPVIISLPSNAALRPGEIVDLHFQKPRQGANARRAGEQRMATK